MIENRWNIATVISEVRFLLASTKEVSKDYDVLVMHMDLKLLGCSKNGSRDDWHAVQAGE